MKLAHLSGATLERLKSWRWDRIIEKHEGPEDWASVIEYYEPDFLNVNGLQVLLPVGKERHRNITIVRCIVGVDGKSVTLFLKDTSYVSDPDCEFFQAGFVAVCDRFPDENFYVAVVYHEWFMVDNNKARSRRST